MQSEEMAHRDLWKIEELVGNPKHFTERLGMLHEWDECFFFFALAISFNRQHTGSEIRQKP